MFAVLVKGQVTTKYYRAAVQAGRLGVGAELRHCRAQQPSRPHCIVSVTMSSRKSDVFASPLFLSSPPPPRHPIPHPLWSHKLHLSLPVSFWNCSFVSCSVLLDSLVVWGGSERFLCQHGGQWWECAPAPGTAAQGVGMRGRGRAGDAP